jgi:hypothetical protein
MREEPTLKPRNSSQSFYEIRVEGELGEMWANWFEGLSIRKESDPETGRTITVIDGPITDQPALHAVLSKIRDLNLTLLLFKRSERTEK